MFQFKDETRAQLEAQIKVDLTKQREMYIELDEKRWNLSRRVDELESARTGKYGFERSIHALNGDFIASESRNYVEKRLRRFGYLKQVLDQESRGLLVLTAELSNALYEVVMHPEPEVDIEEMERHLEIIKKALDKWEIDINNWMEPVSKPPNPTPTLPPSLKPEEITTNEWTVPTVIALAIFLIGLLIVKAL